MIGLDTNILVAHAIPDHPAHDRVHAHIGGFLIEGQSLAITSGIVAEFLHVITDTRRFQNPLTMEEALEWADFWSHAEEVRILPSELEAHRQWLAWMAHHRLGRKRLLDTLIAATWHVAGVTEIFTLNAKDFRVFDVFTIHGLEP